MPMTSAVLGLRRWSLRLAGHLTIDPRADFGTFAQHAVQPYTLDIRGRSLTTRHCVAY